MAAKDQSTKVVLENLKDQIKKSVRDQLNSKDKTLESVRDQLNSKDKTLESLRDQLNSKDKTLESCKNCADLEDTNNHLYAMVDSLVNTVKTQAKVNLSFQIFQNCDYKYFSVSSLWKTCSSTLKPFP